MNHEALANFNVVHSADMDKVRDVLGHEISKQNGRHSIEFATAQARLDAKFNRVQLSESMSVNYFSYGGPVSVDAVTGEYILIQLPLAGEAPVISGQQQVYSKPGTGAVVSSNRDLHMTYQDNTERIMVRIGRSALEHHLQSHLDMDVIDPIRFQLSLDIPEHQPFGISDTILRIVKELDSQGEISPIAVPCMEDLLMSLLLRTQPHNYRDQLAGNPYTSPKSYYVSRAEQYLRANTAQPISMDDLVTETGVSARSLFAGFRNTYGMSPMAYLKSLRLQNTHQELLAADPAQSRVTDVASRWGFLHFGNFAADYRKKFGENPSKTLRKSG
jgi:AraC-like DNA-binding protein